MNPSGHMCETETHPSCPHSSQARLAPPALEQGFLGLVGTPSSRTTREDIPFYTKSIFNIFFYDVLMQQAFHDSVLPSKHSQQFLVISTGFIPSLINQHPTLQNTKPTFQNQINLTVSSPGNEILGSDHTTDI